MATGNTDTDADPNKISENPDECPGEPPPYSQVIKESQVPRKESQASFVSVDLDFQERIYSAGYDQDYREFNPQSLTQYDENFYQPTLQPYTNLGQIRDDVLNSSRQRAYNKWYNGPLDRNLHIKISQKNQPVNGSGQRPFRPSNQYQAGYDQPLTQIPTFSTNFNIGFSQQRARNTNTSVSEQPKPAHFRPEKPYTMLIPAIFACFCCLPTGICAIIATINAKNALASGDTIGAQKNTTMAQRLTLASMVIGIMWVTIVIVIVTTHNHVNYY